MKWLIVGLVFLMGCDDGARREADKVRRELRIEAWNACIDRGGVPIESSFIGPPGMSDCRFEGDHLNE